MFTSEAKVNKIYYETTKVEGWRAGRRGEIKKQRKLWSFDQLNTKITWQENWRRLVQLNIPKIVMGGLISCNQKHFYLVYMNVK